MTLARSKVTAQGQVSVPAEVRRKLGVGPGSLLEWHEEGESIVLRRAGKYSFEDIQKALFPGGKPRPHDVAEMKEGIREYIRKRHARR